MPVHPVFNRLALITGEPALDALRSSRAFVFGLGGVGSWCAEGLSRSGIGSLVLVDSDVVCLSNVNRQLEAVVSNEGRPKASELEARIKSIHPFCEVTAVRNIYSRENAHLYDIRPGDYVIDAIDSLTFKLDLIEHAVSAGAVLFSSMGAAAKLDPTRFKVSDIWDTQGCPLARLVRQGLRKRGFDGHFPVVFSSENLPRRDEITVAETPRDEAPSCESSSGSAPAQSEGGETIDWNLSKKIINGSAVHVTATVGMILSGLVVQHAYRRFNP
ncbi:MAG TPA: tRNA threonylcarbamoyladenosine dehydratase [Treponemataceae bacterium]|nr:tRNA threonylcarbamoyladenosine dehydratase [Treponemataceae bacterium]